MDVEPLDRQTQIAGKLIFLIRNTGTLFAHFRNSTSDAIKNKQPRMYKNIFQFKV